ncbi:hypothetical protein EBR78_03760 [bacterium]|nr:hypothetical protein [bacterium]NBX82360.1 hypothetical protein [bacterium]
MTIRFFIPRHRSTEQTSSLQLKAPLTDTALRSLGSSFGPRGALVTIENGSEIPFHLEVDRAPEE